MSDRVPQPVSGTLECGGAEGSSEAAPSSVRVGGVRPHYVERGSGVPVVLIHGSLADYTYRELSEQIPLLAARHRVIAYSRR